MFSRFLIKPLTSLKPEIENVFLEDLKNSKRSAWMTANQSSDGSITFLHDKPDAGFFIARLKKFPKIVEIVSSLYPEVVVENSYATKLLPGYSMLPHIDKNRTTAIVIPLGSNKGELVHKIFGITVNTHIYTSPSLTRVDVNHGANNTSDQIRYALTIEVPGTYYQNYSKYY